MSFLHEIQAPALVPNEFELKGAVVALAYSEVDSAFNRYPGYIHPVPFSVDTETTYRGQQLMLLGPSGEDVMLSRPLSVQEADDPGIRTVEVVAHDEKERLYLLDRRGKGLVMTAPLADGAEECIGISPVVPQIHAQAAIEREQGLPESRSSVRPIRTVRQARALGELIALGIALKHPDA